MTKNISNIKPQLQKSNDTKTKKEVDRLEEIEKQATRNGTTRHNLF